MGKMRNLDDLSAVVPSQFTIQTSYKCPVCGKEHSVLLLGKKWVENF